MVVVMSIILMVVTSDGKLRALLPIVKLKVLKNLCTDILLGQDFQWPHKEVIF